MKPYFKNIILICVLIGVLFGTFQAKSVANDSRKPILTMDVEMPVMGGTVTGISKTFSGGTFSIIKISYINGRDGLVQFWASEASDYSEYDNVFIYGAGAFAVPEGDIQMLIIICRADFDNGLPEKKMRQSKQLIITDQNGKKFASNTEYFNNAVGKYKDFVQVSTMNPKRKPIPEKLKISFFMD